MRPSGQAGPGAERVLVSADFQVGGAYGGVGSRWRTTSWTCTRASLRRGAARLLLPTGPRIRLTGRAAPGFRGGSSPRACRRAAHVGRAREIPTRNLLFSLSVILSGAQIELRLVTSARDHIGTSASVRHALRRGSYCTVFRQVLPACTLRALLIDQIPTSRIETLLRRAERSRGKQSFLFVDGTGVGKRRLLPAVAWTGAVQRV